MTPILKIGITVLVIGAMAELSCKKEYSCENCRETNKSPIANAGKDTAIVLPVDSLTLDGSGFDIAKRHKCLKCFIQHKSGGGSFNTPISPT